MTAINIGYCGVCDITPIWNLKPGKSRPNENYAEFFMHLKDGSIARHAICKNCLSTLTDKQVEDLFGRIQETWHEEMVGWATDKQFDKMRELEVKVWDREEKECIVKYKELRKKEKEDIIKDIKDKIKIKK